MTESEASGPAGSHDFEIADSTEIYTGAIMALRVDDVTMPGGTTARREVVEHFGAVAIAAVDESGRIALVSQYRHPLGRRLLEMPAGLLDGGPEESPIDAAARELVEEMGLHADTWQVLVDVAASPGFTDEVVRVFLATGLHEVDRPQAHDEEADMTLLWMSLDDAVAAVFSGEIVNASSVAGILAVRVARAEGTQLRTPEAPWRDRPEAFDRRRGRS
ncbi:NUDIX hydrolase [Gordonia jinhuaensis]|uniref:Hypothetical MutT/nudix family protein n=2 Tax=Gordonia jinhuaensis TaxID=1517702 RepID=A0A916THY7_9ACTN|nr:hypothetical MutT/nudix family protein [Gordonia jinhuaensis]